jgi:hypothetical protein
VLISKWADVPNHSCLVSRDTRSHSPLEPFRLHTIDYSATAAGIAATRYCALDCLAPPMQLASLPFHLRVAVASAPTTRRGA